MNRSMARSGLSIGLATAVASAFNYGTNMALGRSLGARAFADAALIVSSMLLLSAMATGIQLSVARATTVGRNGGADRGSGRAPLFSGLVIGAMLVLGSPLLAHLFHTQSIIPFVLLGAAMPSYMSLSVRRGLLQAAGDFDRLALTMVVEALGRAAITIALLAVGAGASSAAAGLLGSIVLAWRMARFPGPVRAADRTTTVRADRSASQVPMLLLLSAQVLIANGDVLVVTALLPDQAGVYAAVAMIGRMVYVAAWAVVTVVFPRLAESGAGTRQRSLVRRAQLATAAIGGSMTLAAAVGAQPLLSLLLGEDYVGGASLLWSYTLATTLFAMANLVAIADVAAAARRGPTWLLIGGFVQSSSLVLLAPRGLQWAVWTQVVVMAAVLAGLTVRRSPAIARLLRATANPQLPAMT